MDKRIPLLMMLMLTPPVIADAGDCEVSDCVDGVDTISNNFMLPRSFSSYKAREIISMQDNGAQSGKDDWARHFNLNAGFMQSFGDSECRLGSLPFWSGTNKMTLGDNSGDYDVDLYQFGLGDIVSPGDITLTPRVKHVGVDMLWVLNHKPDEAGFYMKVKAPVGAYMIDMNLCENPAVVNQPDAEWMRYPALDNRYKTLTDVFYGGFPNAEPDLDYGRISSCRNTVVRLADLETVLGYNVWVGDKGKAGLGFKFSAPTGNVPTAEFMLEPVFGRGSHWGVGAEFHANYQVWEGDDSSVCVKLLADVLHLTSGRRPTMRSFDLAANGPGSKYMLLQEYLATDFTGAGYDQGAQPVGTRLPGNIIPAINITTQPVKSTFSVEGSMALLLDFKKNDWNMSIAGEFWGRSKEKLEIDCCKALELGNQNFNDYAVLGRQIDLDGRFDILATDYDNARLYFCEPLARINKAEDRVLAQATPSQIAENNTVMNQPPGGPVVAPDGTTPGVGSGTAVSANTFNADKVKDARESKNRIPSVDGLDVDGARSPRAFSGLVNLEVGYTWSDSDYVPHLALLGGVEFADKTSKMVSMWSVGLQGSLQF